MKSKIKFSIRYVEVPVDMLVRCLCEVLAGEHSSQWALANELRNSLTDEQANKLATLMNDEEGEVTSEMYEAVRIDFARYQNANHHDFDHETCPRVRYKNEDGICEHPVCEGDMSAECGRIVGFEGDTDETSL